MRATPIVWLCVASVCGVCRAQTQFPYELTVGDGPVDVRSGPDEQYYVTGRLPTGARIEVYRHDTDWLAIRPPKGSFSLVRRDQLKVAPRSDVAEVIKDDAACEVGSTVERVDKRASWVRLQQGELVELIDVGGREGKAPAGDTDRKWLRISPPSGEFRWVKAADLQEVSNAETAKAPAINRNRAAIRIPPDDRATHAMARPTHQKRQQRAASIDGKAGEGKDSADAKWISRNARLRDDLADIEVQLSLMVAKDMRSWRLEQLRGRLESNADKLGSEEERTRAKSLLERIGEFEELQNRVVQATGDSPIPEVRRSVAPANATTPGAVERATGVRYDGSGWLVPVHSTKRTAPPYALLDAEGDVLQYVSPTPGLNLHRYLRKQVGIFGQRGLQQPLKKPHLTAERVVDLGRHLR